MICLQVEAAMSLSRQYQCEVCRCTPRYFQQCFFVLVINKFAPQLCTLAVLMSTRTVAIWWRKKEREEREWGSYVFAAYFSERLLILEHAVNIATKM